jgi:hypothetical protein
MDPNANFRERIALARDAVTAGSWSARDRARFSELTDAYADWRYDNGFPASREIRAELIALHTTAWPLPTLS